MNLDVATVRKVATLSRLHLSDEEVTQMSQQLGQVLQFMRQLDSLDTDDVPPLDHAADLHDVFSDDQLRPGLSQEQAVRNAPKHDGQYFLVPPVLAR